MSSSISKGSSDLRLFFHGTSAASASKIAKNGLSIEDKVSGCSSIIRNQFGLVDREHAEYAKMHSDPAIARIAGRKRTLEKDPQDPRDGVYRTKNCIPKACVLSKSYAGRTEERRMKKVKKVANALRIKDDPASIDKLKGFLKQGWSKDSDRSIINRSESPTESEEDRNTKTFNSLAASRVDLTTLEEGAVFSVVFD
jgi:hypothetical protein